jgi:hypothetical protein
MYKDAPILCCPEARLNRVMHFDSEQIYITTLNTNSFLEKIRDDFEEWSNNYGE